MMNSVIEAKNFVLEKRLGASRVIYCPTLGLVVGKTTSITHRDTGGIARYFGRSPPALLKGLCSTQAMIRSGLDIGLTLNLMLSGYLDVT